MIEDGVDALVSRFSVHAAAVELTARVEGSPLLECLTADLVLHVFERTGPYLVAGGPARVIVQPETETLTCLDGDDPAPLRSIEVTAVSMITASGIVRSCEAPFVVVDAGLPLVVAVDRWPAALHEGDRVRFQSRAPVHGFVLPPERRGAALATDDQV